MRKIYRITFIFFALALMFLLIFPVVSHEKEMTDITVFGLGKADSILIKNKGKTILIDAGHKRDKEVLADKLKTLGVRTIDYMILSHPDKDHIGGASYIVDRFRVKNLVQTPYVKGNKDEARLRNSLEKTDTKVINLKKDMDLELGDLKIHMFVALADFDKSNDNSILLLIKDRDLNYLFAGDAEKDLLGEMLERELPSLDLYKVAHHGRENSNSEKFVKKIKPKISIITNSEEESEIHGMLEKNGSKVYFAYDKDVYFYSDGKSIQLRQETNGK